MKKYIWIFLLMSACVKDDLLELKDADKKFANGDYEASLKDYENLIPTQGAPAKVGAGWCYLRLAEYSLAIVQFSDATGDSLADGYAGWAFSLWAKSADSAQKVIDRAEFVLRKSPTFIFSLDKRIDKNDVLYVLASAYLVQQNYSKTLEKIKLMDGQSAYTTDVNAADAEDVLLAKLQSLGRAQVIAKMVADIEPGDEIRTP